MFQGLDSIDSVSPINGNINATRDLDLNRNDNLSNALVLQSVEDRRAPEGKDNDSLSSRELIEQGTKENTYSTDVNGKVTVHVVVTINGNGTLADLKKQRMQIRNSSSDGSSITSPITTFPDGDNASISNNNDIVRFTGETDEVADYSKTKGCCSIQ